MHVEIPRRSWVWTESSSQIPSKDLSIMSWNILSPKAHAQRQPPSLSPSLFPLDRHHPHLNPSDMDLDEKVDSSKRASTSHHLAEDAWPMRLVKILMEISFYRPDILCLQELEESDYHSTLAPLLARLGYSGTYARKRPDNLQDGCGTFWQRSKLVLQEQHTLYYADADLLGPEGPKGQRGRSDHPNACLPTKERIGSPGHRDRAVRFNLHPNLALITHLIPISSGIPSGQGVRIINTHLLANPSFADAKLLQSAVLMDHLASLCPASPVPLILAPLNPVRPAALMGWRGGGATGYVGEDRGGGGGAKEPRGQRGLRARRERSCLVEENVHPSPCPPTPSSSEGEGDDLEEEGKRAHLRIPSFPPPSPTLRLVGVLGGMERCKGGRRRSTGEAKGVNPADRSLSSLEDPYMPNALCPSDHLALMAVFRLEDANS
ncbi:hypothetical protein BJ684DRAFT_15479 [Piptocephalis cylindrospora]|uniref:Uncharacterized protein n=1 Tax=Piptocephalis cylindrospora TaxID=1907219 RepID=A0A4P9Y5B2_9FUNG|nr:hypothetical protein BJ684DRAFT_15479 [Piptocephalis cylindrospora]|eukprot:RKP14186.1 hypothetical protein BJ684DRAFT_15479 [Piptocephalis cylindrospora]